ncbi:MAG: PP2C family protein-serine/threonine phosphatase [Parasporobacterium sp.]|nr:PP2C family protein-serine/threonine phosphatase [Parasporobacterium sp.]
MESENKQKKKHSLSLKVNIILGVIIAAIVACLLLLTNQVYCQKIDSFYIEQTKRAAIDVTEEVPLDLIIPFGEKVDTEEFQAVRNEAISKNDETILIDWMKSKPGFGLTEEDFKELTKNLDADVSEEDFRDKLSLFAVYQQIVSILEQIRESQEITSLQLGYLGRESVLILADLREGVLQVGAQPDDYENYHSVMNDNGVEAYITETKYGWLCTVLEPIIDPKSQEIVAVGEAAIDMDVIIHERKWFIVNCIAVAILLAAVGIGVSVFIFRKIATNPLKKLALGTASFKSNDDGFKLENVIKDDFHSNDEIGELFQEVRAMQTRIVKDTNHLQEATAEKERIQTELALAARIQADMLPRKFPAFPDRKEFDIYASMTPAKEVGGDFYDFFLMDDDHLALIMADVSGKGIPGALFMMMSKSLIQNFCMAGRSPKEVLETVNTKICQNNQEEMFVTVWLGILEISSGKLTAVNAGHEFPIIKKPDGPFEVFKDKHGFVVGGMESIKYKEYELQLVPGTKLFVYTDGVPEATNANNELFGIERTVSALNEAKEKSPQQILEAVDLAVGQFVGDAEQFDDLTMLCFEYKSFSDPS